MSSLVRRNKAVMGKCGSKSRLHGQWPTSVWTAVHAYYSVANARTLASWLLLWWLSESSLGFSFSDVFCCIALNRRYCNRMWHDLRTFHLYSTKCRCLSMLQTYWHTHTIAKHQMSRVLMAHIIDIYTLSRWGWTTVVNTDRKLSFLVAMTKSEYDHVRLIETYL